MNYKINDSTLINELCTNIRTTVKQKSEKIEMLPENFHHPLDDEIIGETGDLAKLLLNNEDTISYAKAEKLDELWGKLLDKSIKCLRYFDNREPFLKNSDKAIVAYGIDKLKAYHQRYTEFEGLLYGASSYYRDHVFHAVRVWMLGIFCLLNKKDDDDDKDTDIFISKLTLDGGAIIPGKINFFEYISMWTIAALCHDLGYPLEKAEQILDKTRKMMREFVPNPNVWNNFGYSGTQDSINEYILKFISTKMVFKEELAKKQDNSIKVQDNSTKEQEESKNDKEKIYVGRIQPKYYLKYAKSLENFQHGVISTVIIYKMLLYFLESDFNLNDDYIYSSEDARQFYIRREILRAIASHTCPDAYNIHITTFSSLLFICDELQEWGRKTWNELYTGLNENSVSLDIETFTNDNVEVSETIDMESIEDADIVVQNICRIFERQYSLYKTTFRDGQDTSKRDFDLKKALNFNLSTHGAKTRSISIEYVLPKSGPSSFKVDLSKSGTKKERDQYKKAIEDTISKKLYGNDLIIS